MSLPRTTFSLLAVLLLFAPAAFTQSATAAPPKLVLQVTVDQLRGDMPARYLDRMGEGGFRYLLGEGLVFANAHHAHANTETIVGHATLATGAHPSGHGMVANVWLDRASSELRYNIEDARYHLLTEGADVDKKTEIDPTQRTARSDGRSPAAILSSTFSDELAIHTAGAAKIFGVSIKDRGAVSMAGHAGKAFWFSKKSTGFVTSSFYYEAYPDWVTAWNAANPAQSYADTNWELLGERATYLFADRDDQPWETALPGFGRLFPHRYGPAEGRGFGTYLTLSPAGDELTLDFAKALVENEDIGADDTTDYLSVSFSSTDYVGHVFGPSSLEAEDNLLRLDRTLADLFSFIDETVGLDETLVVFSADHGGPEAPPDLNAYGIEAKYVQPKKWDKAKSIETLKKQFGVGEDLILEFFQPYVYLNRKLIQEKGLDRGEVQRAVAAEIVKFEGVALAVPSTDLMEGRIPDTAIYRSVLNNHHPKRSGDIFIVFQPHWFINDFDGLTVAATHGSPWTYDTYVPLIFAGAAIRPARIHRAVQTIDLAPTLAAYLDLKPPSASTGQVLTEVLNRH